MYSNRTIARLGLATLLGALFALGSTDAQAATCDPASPTCSVAPVGSMKAQITKRIGTEIDSGWMDKGLIKVRTRVAIDPVGTDPLVALEMSKGGGLAATWPQPGTIELRADVAPDATGTIAVHYTLTPSLEADIYGVKIAYNATDLLNKLQGASFNYDARASAAFAPGLAVASVKGPAPALDKSTIFSLPLDALGVDPDIVTGVLAIQATTSPTFTFTTKDVRIDGAPMKDGVSRIPSADADAMDVSVQVSGDLTMQGTLKVKPVVRIDTVAGWDTYGLTKFSFSAVSKDYGTSPPIAVPVTFERRMVHIPLPNVKVAAKGVDFGSVKAGGGAKKSVSIDNTGEKGAELSFSSSDPQFVVPSGAVRVGSKSKYDLEVQLKPSSDAPASATITVKSNDPDSPEQTFKVGANGASVESSDTDDTDGPLERRPAPTLDAPSEDSSGCAVASIGVHAGTSAWGLLGLGLAALVVARRRR